MVVTKAPNYLAYDSNNSSVLSGVNFVLRVILNFNGSHAIDNISNAMLAIWLPYTPCLA